MFNPKLFLAAASVSLLCTPVFAQAAPDGAADHHGWHMPGKEQMAAWHAQMCKDHYAHEAGRLAFLQVSLGITEAQRGAFDRWRDEKLAAAKSHSDECLAHQPMTDGMHDGKHDALERNARMEKHLEQRLAEMKSERPALEAFYGSLTPEQKMLFDRESAMHGHHHHMMGDHMMGGHMMGGDHGPDEHGPD